jgi:hypothetical protein
MDLVGALATVLGADAHNLLLVNSCVRHPWFFFHLQTVVFARQYEKLDMQCIQLDERTPGVV